LLAQDPLMQVSDPVLSDALAQPPALPSPSFRRRLLALAEVALCSSVPTQVAIGAALGAAGMSPVDDAGGLSRSFIVTLSLLDTALLLTFMIWLMREHGESPRALWLGTRPVSREARFGLVMVPALILGVGLLLNSLRLVAPFLRNVPTNPFEQLAARPGDAVILAVVAIVAGGLREELQRAFLLRRFEQYLGGAGVGIFVLSVGFGLGHYVQGWDAVITTGALGAVWAWIYIRRRSSVAPVVSHSTFNALEIVRVGLMGT
jgi:membrane protease YdiL (CAAX protease family)